MSVLLDEAIGLLEDPKDVEDLLKALALATVAQAIAVQAQNSKLSEIINHLAKAARDIDIISERIGK